MVTHELVFKCNTWRWPGRPPAACLWTVRCQTRSRIIGDGRERWGSTSKDKQSQQLYRSERRHHVHAVTRCCHTAISAALWLCRQVCRLRRDASQVTHWHIMVTWDFMRERERRALLLASTTLSLATAKTFRFPKLTVVSLLKSHRRAS